MDKFPIQTERDADPHPLSIPWEVAELAYSVYAGRYGTAQTLKRLAERGGFAPSEMDEFVPDWRKLCCTMLSLAEENGRLASEVGSLKKALGWIEWLLERGWTVRALHRPSLVWEWRTPNGISGDDYQSSDFGVLPPSVEGHICANAVMTAD